MNSKLGDFLKDQRKNLGITAAEIVGKRADISDAYVLMIEKSKREPTFKILPRQLNTSIKGFNMLY